MTKTRTRTWGILLATVLLLSLLPVAAMADEVWSEVSSVDSLSTALASGGNIKLTDDIAVCTTQGWAITEDVVLDLNGHSITSTYAEANNYIMTVNGASLTITDNSTPKSGKIAATDPSYGYGIQLKGNNSNFTLLAGTIETTQETVDIYTLANGCSITISGGKLISSDDSVLGIRGSGTKVNITGGEMESNGRTGVYISCYGSPDSIIFDMTGGKLTHTGGASGAIQLYKGATLTVGGTADITSSSYAVQVQENTILNVGGGTLSSTGTCVISSGETSTVNITGGEIDGSGTVIRCENTSTVSISGGTLTTAAASSYYPIIDKREDTSQVSISGGTFLNSDGSANEDIKAYIQSGLTQDAAGNIIVDPETAEAKIGDVNYVTLTDALKDAVSGNTVILLQDEVKLEEEIPEGVILAVSSGQTLQIAAEKLAALIDSEGEIRVNAGGVLDVGGTEMIGSSDTNICLTGGYIDISVSNSSALMLEFTGATAEVPEGYRWTLSKSVGQDTIPVHVTLDASTTLTVNSTGADGENDGFRVANGAVLTNAGKIVVNGVMSISSTGEVRGDGTIQIASGGVLKVNTSRNTGDVGALTNNVSNSGTFIWNGDDGAALSGTITLASGSKVYSQADIESNLSGSKRALSDKTYNGTEYAYAWEYYVSSPIINPVFYTVTVSSATNGKVTVLPSATIKGAAVTITVTPDDGYVLDVLTVKDAFGNAIALTESDGKYIFKMPGSVVKVSATFKAASSSLPFTDVGIGDWFYESVQYAYENGMMNGVGNNLFAPTSNLTRGMMAQVFYNLEGRPAAGSGVFTDVAAGQWYADAVNWAVANGIVSGYGNGKFGPKDNMTREQLAQILYNYVAFKGYDVSLQGDLSAFNDGAETSQWALTAMKWAVGTGLIQGYNGNLDPTGTATRAEVAQLLMNFCEYIEK